jgi:hypothetical protein
MLRTISGYHVGVIRLRELANPTPTGFAFGALLAVGAILIALDQQ